MDEGRKMILTLISFKSDKEKKNSIQRKLSSIMDDAVQRLTPAG
jgi:hypothetical protein